MPFFPHARAVNIVSTSVTDNASCVESINCGGDCVNSFRCTCSPLVNINSVNAIPEFDKNILSFSGLF